MDSERIMNAQFLFCVLFFFVCGTLSGSFFNCMAMRIVRGKDWTRGRSECPYCGHVLKSSDLIPLFSYLFLKGRCRYCKEKISIRYPLTELIGGLICVLTYLRLGFSAELFFDLILFFILFGLSLVDLESYIIPDGYILAGIINRLIERFVIGKPVMFFKDLSGAFVIAGGIYLIALLMSRSLKKESFGGGDIKLIFMIALYTGIYEGIFVLFLSSLMGLLMMILLKKDKIPFGPYLSLSAFIVFLYGELILFNVL